jgi:hypothetical protein
MSFTHTRCNWNFGLRVSRIWIATGGRHACLAAGHSDRHASRADRAGSAASEYRAELSCGGRRLDPPRQSERERLPAGRALARLGGPPSYVELLTCLQMAKTAKNLPTDGEMNGRAGR